jgi:hypothetical protein
MVADEKDKGGQGISEKREFTHFAPIWVNAHSSACSTQTGMLTLPTLPCVSKSGRFVDLGEDNPWLSLLGECPE